MNAVTNYGDTPLKTVVRKPRNGITSGKTAERTTQRTLTTGIVTDQLTRIPTRMRDVATTTTADLDLLERLRSALQHQNGLDPLLCGGDGRHVTGRATPDNDQIMRAGSAGRRRCCSSACPLVGVRH